MFVCCAARKVEDILELGFQMMMLGCPVLFLSSSVGHSFDLVLPLTGSVEQNNT